MASSKAMAISLVFLLSVLSQAVLGLTNTPKYHHLPPLREQADIIDGWTKERIDAIPSLMQKYGIDAWLISQKEYAEDTVFWSMKSAVQFSARRRTTSIYFTNADGGNSSSYTWIDNTPDLWTELRRVLELNKPQYIAVNADADIAFSSGLHAGELSLIAQELGERWAERLVSVPMLAVEYIATMPRSRLAWYRKLMETAWAMIADGFSERVIQPGKTTTEDVEWWLRERIQEMNYTTWFQPSVTIVSASMPPGKLPGDDPQPYIINYGDMLHVDFGVTALGLNTDTQHLAYVLPPGRGETDVPKSLRQGLKTVNRLQDILRSCMVPGKTGNEILAIALGEMRNHGIKGKIYSHPIGDWGHSAGTLIGMTNLQDGVPVLGDLPLLKNTYYSIELYAESWIPELNATLPFYQEEDVYWDEETGGFEWVFGRQEEFHLIKTLADDASFVVQS